MNFEMISQTADNRKVLLTVLLKWFKVQIKEHFCEEQFSGDRADPVYKNIHREKDKKVMTTALSATKTDLTDLC